MDTLLQVTASWILPAMFFWFLFSIIAMITIEIYQRFAKSRQKGLEEVLKALLGESSTTKFYQHALVNPLEDEKRNHNNTKNEDRRPSYISAVASSFQVKMPAGSPLKADSTEALFMF